MIARDIFEVHGASQRPSHAAELERYPGGSNDGRNINDS